MEWPDNRRAGVLGFASVLAMTWQHKQGSPVLRGAWVLDTLLGTPVPAPPADVPPLEQAAKSDKGLTMRQILARHQAVHLLHLPQPDRPDWIRAELDWMGRWRDTETNGQPSWMLRA